MEPKDLKLPPLYAPGGHDFEDRNGRTRPEPPMPPTLRELQRRAREELLRKPNQPRFYCRGCEASYPLSFGTYAKIRGTDDYELHCRCCVKEFHLEKDERNLDEFSHYRRR